MVKANWILARISVSITVKYFPNKVRYKGCLKWVTLVTYSKFFEYFKTHNILKSPFENIKNAFRYYAFPKVSNKLSCVTRVA